MISSMTIGSLKGIAHIAAVWSLRSLMAILAALSLVMCFELLPDQHCGGRFLFDKCYLDLRIDDRKVFAAVSYGWPSKEGNVRGDVSCILGSVGRGSATYFRFRGGQLPLQMELRPDYVFWRPSWGYGTGAVFLEFKTNRTGRPNNHLYFPVSRILLFPLWLPALIFALPPAVYGSMRFFTSTRHRRRHGLCLTCGYDLRASPLRCPECGTATSFSKAAVRPQLN